MRRSPEWGLALLRVAMGMIFLVHGWDKLIGWDAGGFTNMLVRQELPTVLAWLVTFLEFFGGLLLIVGWFTPWAAGALFLEMLVAMFTVHVENGFFVFRDAGEWGYEFHITLLGGLACLFLGGGGRLSVDESLTRRSAAESA